MQSRSRLVTCNQLQIQGSSKALSVGYMRAKRTWSAPTRPGMKLQDDGGIRDMDVDYLGRSKGGRSGKGSSGTLPFKGRGKGQSQKPSTGQEQQSTPGHSVAQKCGHFDTRAHCVGCPR